MDIFMRSEDKGGIMVWEEIAESYGLVANEIVKEPIYSEVHRKCVEYGILQCEIRMEKPIGEEEPIKMFGSSEQIRGRKDDPSRKMLRFYERFPELCIDDPEDEFNNLIHLLRGSIDEYFKQFDE